MKAFHVYFTVGVENDSMIFLNCSMILIFLRRFGQGDPWIPFQHDVLFYASLKIEISKEDKAHNSLDHFSRLYYSEEYMIFISY